MRAEVLEQELRVSLNKTIIEQGGTPINDVDCAGDLEGSVDSQMRCAFHYKGRLHEAVVVVTSVAGDSIDYMYEVVEF
jgi:hypothetical protein